MGEINDIGGISLSLFLGMAMITLKIWQLAELALPPGDFIGRTDTSYIVLHIFCSV